MLVTNWGRAAVAIAATLALLLPPGAAYGQQMVPPGQFYIAGVPFMCGNVVTLLYPSGTDIATATPGAINLNWPMFSSMPHPVQAFVYAHECAHHLFGSDENRADCWAVQIGRDQRFLKRVDLDAICRSVWFSPGDWTHFPGPVRCQNMIQCFG